MPDVTGPVPDWIQIQAALGDRILGAGEEFQAHPCRIPAEEAKIHPGANFMGAQRQGEARPDIGALGGLR
jgi:hypothetical protein